MFKCVPNLFKVVQMCSNVFQHCSNVFKYVQNLFKCVLMCSIVLKCVCTLFKCVQICSNMFKICSNVLNCVQNLFKCFWTLFKCVQMISYVFKCVQVMVMGGLWVAKVGFGRLKVVIGGYEWLSGVCVWVLPWKCNPDNKSSLKNVSSWQNVYPDKTSILTKCPSWQNVHPDKTYIRDKTSSDIQSAQESSVNTRKKFCHPNYSRLRHTNLLGQHNFCIFSEKHWI